MSTTKETENYLGRNCIISYIKSRQINNFSYRSFLNANRDAIIASILPAYNCDDLDITWTRHFLKEARSLLDQKTFIELKNKVFEERLQHKKYLQVFWQRIIEEYERKIKKRKQVEDKENVQPSKKCRNDITLFCWVRGDFPAAVHAITIRINKENTIGELKDIIRGKIDVSIIAKDIKLWKIEIPDNRDDELAKYPLKDHNMLQATREIHEYWKEMPPKRHIHVIVVLKKCSIEPLKHGINSLLNDHNIDELCLYIESKLKEWIKRGNLRDDRELVTKLMFHTLLSNIPNYFVDTEVPIDVCHNKVKSCTLFADLLIVEAKSANNAKQNQFIIEFKNKNINFLDLRIRGSNSNWEIMEQKAKKVETMSISDLRQLKCGNAEQFDKGKTIENIFDDACKQLLNYVHNLKDDYHISAFVVMSVGSRRLIWEKIN
ncbi:hypothetical protein RclHR1_01630008 [Rhizophagus clarus]|uniref:Crinkler effector protein N-terminal domain-containing protein n=1 Tax=Rhizophagus clarus TaxID=94130 RepID=A0A2Z6QHB9_9GLOM|nr:hypothetical protein RclHR1_01630008 [Rhizophagus clarus]GES90085.1 hypothetical protein GLOIN_2v1801740 [Rhizophagus clarus]